MRDPTDATISKWPFFVGDVLLFGAAVFVYAQSKLPMGLWEMCFAGLCLAAGAVLGIAPFVLEYRATVKLAEAGALATVVAQIQNLEAIAAQIRSATVHWQEVQEQAGKTSLAAKEIAERMRAEVEAFTQFMQRMNESEKATLRLEVEKLRRAEVEWLQVVVRMLDHVYAFTRALSAPANPMCWSKWAASKTPVARPLAALGWRPLRQTPRSRSTRNDISWQMATPACRQTQSSARRWQPDTPSRENCCGRRWCG